MGGGRESLVNLFRGLARRHQSQQSLLMQLYNSERQDSIDFSFKSKFYFRSNLLSCPSASPFSPSEKYIRVLFSTGATFSTNPLLNPLILSTPSTKLSLTPSFTLLFLSVLCITPLISMFFSLCSLTLPSISLVSLSRSVMLEDNSLMQLQRDSFCSQVAPNKLVTSQASLTFSLYMISSNWDLICARMSSQILTYWCIFLFLSMMFLSLFLRTRWVSTTISVVSIRLGWCLEISSSPQSNSLPNLSNSSSCFSPLSLSLSINPWMFPALSPFLPSNLPISPLTTPSLSSHSLISISNPSTISLFLLFSILNLLIDFLYPEFSSRLLLQITRVLHRSLVMFLILMWSLEGLQDSSSSCFNHNLVSEVDFRIQLFYFDTEMKCFFLDSSLETMDDQDMRAKEEFQWDWFRRREEGRWLGRGGVLYFRNIIMGGGSVFRIFNWNIQ